MVVWDIYTTPRSQFYHATDRDPQFWLGSMGTPVPRTDVGFDLHRNWTKSVQTHHVPTQWKMPTFIDGEFNNFTFFGDPKELLPQAILGLNDDARDAWYSFKVGTFKNWRVKRKIHAATVYDQCWNNTIDYSVHQSTLEDAIEAYFAQTGLLLDGVSLVETKARVARSSSMRALPVCLSMIHSFVEGLTGLKRVSVRICSYGQSLITPTTCLGITIDYSSNLMVEI